MIHIKATIKGEPDVPALVRIIDYADQVFKASVSIIQEKIKGKIKINANEALIAYCHYVIKSIRYGKRASDIKKGASKILSPSDVMIGVPETLQAITFEVKLQNRIRKITIKNPMPTSSYVMA